jgi:peptide-methionine (S)-S-oxide reductase
MRNTALALAILLSTAMPASAGSIAKVIPAPALDNPLAAGADQVAVLSGGCYWGMQGLFEHVKGIKKVTAGFSGIMQIPGESDVIANNHPASEAVQIDFDPSQISYGKLLQIFFSVAHNPIEVDRQGPDTGAQYRSEIYFLDDTQKKIAEAYIAQLDATHIYSDEIATHVSSLSHFQKVRLTEQDFTQKHPDAPYVVVNDEPRVQALKIIFPNYYLDPPLTYSGS